MALRACPPIGSAFTSPTRPFHWRPSSTCAPISPTPATHRLYQDHGTTELDALYAPYQVMVNDLARERGYEDGKSFDSRVFEGTGHNEKAWASRLAIPLQFLLGKR